ncbi:UNVERIFIED_CONTAM: hypothetical protein Scaly_2810400 [Sesamum calycinum]|uniref:Retrotransposon gag domain-containing protein n=1 Tax=Sesamum calycinum TaxID=2727403 RepID=A0AAW2IUF4_9LAMI
MSPERFAGCAIPDRRPEGERQSVPFTEVVMADELPANCRTLAIIEYDGTMDPLEHLSRFENAALLHRYTDGIKCRVFVTTLARAAQQWFNQLSTGSIRSFQEFNAATLEVPSATQEVKIIAFSQGLLDRDFFKSLAKKPVSKFDALLARAAKYINMEDSQAAKKESRGRKEKSIHSTNVPSPSSIAVEGKCLLARPKSWKDDPTIPCLISFVVFTTTTTILLKNADISRTKSKGLSKMDIYKNMYAGRKLGVRDHIRRNLGCGGNGRCSSYPIRTNGETGPKNSHNDALVITALLANYEVGRIFIDSESSADTLFGEAYDQMKLKDIPLKKVNTSLYEFAGEVVYPRGMILLPLTLGTRTPRKTCMLKFLVMDVPSAYNTILGRPTLNAFQAIISTYHIKIKFSTFGGVGEVQGDPLQSKKCYVEVVCKGQKRSTKETHLQVPSNRREKKIQQEGEGTSPKVQPTEEL